MTGEGNTQQTRDSQNGNGQVAESEPHVTHLLAADEAVRQGYGWSAFVAVCGELVCSWELPPSMCSPNRDEHRYCPACVREVLRWKAESSDAAHIVAQLEQLRELVVRDG